LDEELMARFGNRFHYITARRRECEAALKLANVSREKIVEWGVPQLELSYQLVDLSKRLSKLFLEISPQVVLTHAYEGGHPDHDATAFAVHAAVRSIRRNGLKPPLIYEMAIYPGADGSTKVPEFLLKASRESTTLTLDRVSAELKQRMFDCFATQEEILSETPLGPEKFREAPLYDFRLPPYFGKLHYEQLGLGMSGKKWRSLARQALRTLFPKAMAAPYLLRPQSRVMAIMDH
jgi:LmbE family N-acetylglucosaminyl deacetylase